MARASELQRTNLNRRVRAQIEGTGPGRAKLVRRRLKMSEVVALEIIRDVVSDDLEPGDKLPLEPDMLAKYGVSRSSLREALRLLEVQGLIVIRPGPGASTVVGRIHPANLARTVMLYLHLDGVTYDQLLAAWLHTEPLLARLAASNPDRVLVRQYMLPFVPAKGNEAAVPVTIGVAFHDAVARLADNPVLGLILQSIGHLVTDYTLNVVERRTLDDQLRHDHDDLADAILAGDAARAEALMREHVEHVIDLFKAYWPAHVGERVELD
ncbi:MAG TPA: GntR family transcriptional regulator [Stellaceae bacterium]|nr:GntR family transcriptional regulator [Stellaceae bacterium]